MSIKDSAETWVRGAPGQALILVAAVGIVIGGVVGLGAGFKIEQNRTRSDVKKLRAQLQQGVGGSGGTAPSASASLGQRIGKVTTDRGGHAHRRDEAPGQPNPCTRPAPRSTSSS